MAKYGSNYNPSHRFHPNYNPYYNFNLTFNYDSTYESKLHKVIGHNQMSFADFRLELLKHIDPDIRKLLNSPCQFHLYFEPVTSKNKTLYRLFIARSIQVTSTPAEDFYDSFLKQNYISKEENREPFPLKCLRLDFVNPNPNANYVVFGNNRNTYYNYIDSKQFKSASKMYKQCYNSVLIDVYFNSFQLSTAMARHIGRSIIIQ